MVSLVLFLEYYFISSESILIFDINNSLILVEFC